MLFKVTSLSEIGRTHRETHPAQVFFNSTSTGSYQIAYIKLSMHQNFPSSLPSPIKLKHECSRDIFSTPN